MSQVVLAPHQLMLIKFFHDYTLDLNEKPEMPVTYKRLSIVETDQPLLDDKT